MPTLAQRHVPLLLTALLFGGFLSPEPLAAAESSTAWWEQETNLADDGSLDLSQKPWWPQAQALKPGESFALRSGLPGGGRMLVRCKTLGKQAGKPYEAIVWVLDDDGDMQPDDRDGDRDSDCHVVDYGRDGTVDRVVDYLDDDADGQADEMDIRCFVKGRLQTLWVGVDLDNDGHMWDIRDYTHNNDFFRCDPYGNSLIYANKYDPEQKRWWPISECPFSFYDTRGTGRSDLVVRVSAVPIPFDPLQEPDLGNSSFAMPFSPRLRKIGAVNVRYSVDLDGGNTPERPLHYECGFNLIGHVPYDFPGMARENPLRRAPKTTYCIPTDAAIRLAEDYPAEQTGFSWREYGDPLRKIGDEPHREECRRWEGVFWTWSRRIMHDTGTPIQDWNTRREFRSSPSTRRELYYARADRRIHLRGASEGWTRIGHLGNDACWGEIRMFDTNEDGYFDRWETYRADSSMPVRISTVSDPGIRPLPHDWEGLRQLYVNELLPEALAADRKLIEAMQQVVAYEPSANLVKALEACTSDSERQYVLDVIREEHYLALRRKLLEEIAPPLDSFEANYVRTTTGKKVPSAQAWETAVALTRLDVAYAEGRYDDAAATLREMTSRPASAN